MDIEKMIEQLRRCAGLAAYYDGDYNGIYNQAATALSALQAENEKLRADLEYEREHANAYHEECGQWEAENEKLRAELEQAKRERDAAVDCCSGYCASCLFVKDCAKHDMNDAAPTRWYYGDCEDWEWRGWKEG